MKILFTIGSLDSGGAEKVVTTLANNFCENGHNVAILMISENEKKSFYSLNKSLDLIPLLNKQQKYSINTKINEIKKEIEKFDPDVVIAFLNYVIVYTYFALKRCSNRKKISFIVSERNNPKVVPSSLGYRMLRNHIFKKADGCVFQTQDSKNYFKRIKKSAIIPNPVFLNNVSPRTEISDDVLMVGSDKKEKNRSMAFKAFAIYKNTNPNSKLIVVGEDSNKEEKDLIKRLNIENCVIFVGKQKDWHEKYIDSKMFVLSSDFEGMPNALLEACALQIPCVSTNCPSGGPKEILENGKRGILVPVNNHVEMAKQMNIISKNIELSDYYSKINADLKSLYDERKIAKRWLEFIEYIKDSKN